MNTPDSRIAGVVPVLAVPFQDDGTVDTDGFGRVVEHSLATGVTAVMLFGFASEFGKLTDDERGQLRGELFRRTRQRDDVAALVSITDHSTELAVERARQAVAEGADALNLLPPYQLSPRADQVRAHVGAVLEAVDVPVVLQYAPAQTGTALDAAILLGLAARHPNLTHAKIESQPPGRLIAQLAAGEPALPSLVGYAGLHLPDALRRGAVGVQPGCSFTELYQRIWRLWTAGSVDAAIVLHNRMLPYLSSWMQHIEIIVQAEKTILHRRGIIASDRCRAPGWPFDDDEQSLVDRFLLEFADELAVTTV